MKFLTLAFLVLAGCSSSGGSGGGSPLQKPLSGTPISLNGEWAGTGTVKYGGEPTQNMNFKLVVSKLPTGFDLEIGTTDEAGGQAMDTSLTGHRIVNNTIFDIRDDANVGEVGENGFSIGRPNVGQIDARRDANGLMTVHAVTDYGSGYTVIYDATLSKR